MKAQMKGDVEKQTENFKSALSAIKDADEMITTKLLEELKQISF